MKSLYGTSLHGTYLLANELHKTIPQTPYYIRLSVDFKYDKIYDNYT